MPDINKMSGNTAQVSPSGKPVEGDLGWRGNFYKTAAPGLIMGMTLGDLTKLLAENGEDVPVRYWPKVAFAGTLSLLTTPVRRVEDALLGRRVAEQRVEKPLFIIGHWR